jgi:hypothetical protein
MERSRNSVERGPQGSTLTLSKRLREDKENIYLEEDKGDVENTIGKPNKRVKFSDNVEIKSLPDNGSKKSVPLVEINENGEISNNISDPKSEPLKENNEA